LHDALPILSDRFRVAFAGSGLNLESTDAPAALDHPAAALLREYRAASKLSGECFDLPSRSKHSPDNFDAARYSRNSAAAGWSRAAGASVDSRFSPDPANATRNRSLKIGRASC